MSDWKRMEKLLEEDTERNCRKIEEFVEGFNVDDSDEDIIKPAVKDVWSLKSIQSPGEEIISAGPKKSTGGIFCQKAQELQEIPEFLKISLSEVEETADEKCFVKTAFIEETNPTENEEADPKCLIEELDLD